MDVLFVGMCSILLTSGVWFALLRRSAKTTTTLLSNDPGNERIQINEQRIRGMVEWFAIMADVQQLLIQSSTLPTMAQGLKQTFRQVNPKLGILLAFGSIQDIDRVNQSRENHAAISLNSGAYITCFPDIEAELSADLAHVVYNALAAKESTRRWWLLHDLAPEIQKSLLKQYHLAGQAVVIPLTFHNVLYGVMMVSGFAPDDHAVNPIETGERATLIGGMITARIQGMLPQIHGEHADEPLTSALASLESMEQAVLTLQEQAASVDMLHALADYSQFSTTQIAETSLLAAQTCTSLVRICQAELAMVLLPQEGGKFAVAAMQVEGWSWSHYASLQKQTTTHPLLRDEHVFSSWPDEFTRKPYSSREFDQAVTHKEVFMLANRLSAFDLESVLVRPAFLNQQLQALIVIGMKRPGGFPETVIAVTASVTAITAMSLKSFQMAQERRNAIKGWEDARKMSSTLANQAVEAMAMIAATHGMLAIRRPQEIAKYSLLLAERLSIPKSDMFPLRLAALTGDLGMIAIPSSILRKETGFTQKSGRSSILIPK